ncbi:uncharacterized protein LOC109849987 [Asparagus officinalis]|uniref:uncharacterized protein LOC109849987 n=1 Tax=Asparagus officinalis TaxID=4686 RepID=UPI00098E0A0A|nr:uncharacterized protein LOC109849987 [Asparagus officinalis]
MATKKSAMAARARAALRLALLWARRGGSLKRRLMLKSVLSTLRTSRNGNRFGPFEREFSFDEAPSFFSFKMRRPASLRIPKIPCVGAPAVDFDGDDGRMLCEVTETGKREVIKGEYEDEDSVLGCGYLDFEGEEEEGKEEGIDSKAEEFISNFYEQMKLQRQVSLIRYNEMLLRGIS